jgi:hypothetical protein
MIAGFWLAIGIAAIAASAIAFARHDDVRSVIRLGASLAAVQFLDPMGGLIVAALVPGLLGLKRKGMRPTQSAGLYALVLFMPVVAALVLAYLARFQHVDIPQALFAFADAPPPAAVPPLPLRLIASVAPLAIAAPALLRGVVAERGWTPPDTVIALIAGALSVAAIASTLMGAVRPVSSLAVAAVPLALIAMRNWRGARPRDALIVGCATCALTWGLL